MKKKFRKNIIALSYYEYTKLTLEIAISIMFLLALLSTFWSEASILSVIALFIGIIGISLQECIEAISKNPRDFVEKNTLINIVFSSKNVWQWILGWFILPISLAVIDIGSILLNFIMVILITAIVTILLAKFFSKFFQKTCKFLIKSAILYMVQNCTFFYITISILKILFSPFKGILFSTSLPFITTVVTPVFFLLGFLTLIL